MFVAIITLQVSLVLIGNGGASLSQYAVPGLTEQQCVEFVKERERRNDKGIGMKFMTINTVGECVKID